MTAAASIDDLVDRIYETAFDERAAEQLLRALQRSFRASSAQLLVGDHERHESRMVASLLPREALVAYNRHYWRVDGWRIGGERGGLPIGRPVPGEALISPRELLRSEFWNDHLRIFEQFHWCGVRLGSEGRGHSMISLQRPRAGEPFESDEIAMLEALAPHLQRAVRIMQMLDGARALREATTELFDRLPFGLVLLDARGRILLANRAAAAILDEADGLRATPTGVHAMRATEDGELQRLVSASAARRDRRAGGGAMAVPRPSGARAYAVGVAPVPERGAWPVLGHPAVALFITDPDRLAEPLAPALARLFDLTRAESRLTDRLARGETLAASAAALGMSVETARHHLKAVFRKTRTHRQAELVRLVWSSPAILCGIGDGEPR